MKTAYPQVMGTCKITLYSNIPFDNTYKNHTIISKLFKYNNSDIYSGTPSDANDIKEGFINRKDYSKTGYPYYYPRYSLTGDFNFNFSNGLVGSVTLELTPEQTNANYMKLACGNDVYYYFITGITQNNFDTYTLSLELDVLMTYQDEFLEGMKDVPVFTTRKHSHRYTNNGLYPHCADYKTGDDAFAGVKPSILSDIKDMAFNNPDLEDIRDVKWLYICIDDSDLGEDYCFENNSCLYPLQMFCFPLNAKSITYTDGTNSATFTSTNIYKAIKLLINDGKIHGVKVSSYPPFTTGLESATFSSGDLELTFSTTFEVVAGVLYKIIAGNNILYCNKNIGSTATWTKLVLNGCMILGRQNDNIYDFSKITLGVATNFSKPKVLDDRKYDPKLSFAPFKKYTLTAQYSSEGVELYPELLHSELVPTTMKNYKFTTITTGYIGDNNIFTYLNPVDTTYDGGHYYAYLNYRYNKIGLAGAVNYVVPCGTNALDVFNSTQAQSFYTSKVASGITSTLAIAGGIGSIVLGAGAVAGAPWTGGMSAGAGVGLIASGTTAIAGGVAGGANAIKSTVAKMEDLKNTPDSINISGSNFTSDYAICDEYEGLPYVVEYECSSVIKENANDFFYMYGYQVARECYFNTELKLDNNVPELVDNNLFGRTIFNYVQLNDDLTNKLDTNIPHIIKQKITNIFNQGITIWNFFGFKELWIYNPATPTSTYYLNKWFMKNTLDNTEYDGSSIG